MLRLVNPNESHPVEILGTTFHMRSMSIREKLDVLQALQNIEVDADQFETMLDKLCSVILSIDGYDDVKETIMSLERTEDLSVIASEIINYCTLKVEEEKN